MEDDMQGLYATASEAFRAGDKAGAYSALQAVRAQLSFISAKYERDADPAKFHCAEECCEAVMEMLRANKGTK